ncbi:SMI1/KNR4 family protein [Streptomyces sp. NBC_01547]|uniref:SMI1/KNR4 family protein n=1 Tax=Streptomyces sp. NBC_01547 TaxID=2975873 RepID=UPI00386B00BA
MSGEFFNWQAFLGRWDEEWVPRAGEDSGEALVRPGRQGADEAAIAAAEERLGRRLPPSYRAFLAVSDGWHVDQTAGVYQLGGAADIDWFQDPFDMTPLYEEQLDDRSSEAEILLAGMWQRALRLETDSDITYALLDPGDTDRDGEWALYVYKGWSGELPDRYPSFRAYMEAMYRGFHSDRVERPDFENATTRAQDARVAQARRLVLLGQYEEALPLLEEAASFARPGCAVLLFQLRQMLAPDGTRDYGLLAADPRYLPEVLPVQAMAPAREEWRTGGDGHWLGMMAARGVPRETAEAVLGALRDGTHRYAPPGPWGRAVDAARESSRWGATDAAWRILRDAVGLWEAPGPELIAPIGLLADPLLGPLITPERGREVLATPRAGRNGPAPERVPVPDRPPVSGRVPDLDPPGLAWLTEPEPAPNRRPLDGYRCIWVEGIDPARLPALIGDEGAELTGPTDRHAARRGSGPYARDGRGRGGAEPWEDRAVVAVGRAGDGWAFAFDGDSPHLNHLFLSPAQAASPAGRAVVVWRDPRRSYPGEHPDTFHLSVAERGEELYAFTVRGTEIRSTGAIPEALDPARLFRPEDPAPVNELRVLEALHAELGLSLPRFALTRGRLHTLTTRSWTRAPRAGETFAYAVITRHGT